MVHQNDDARDAGDEVHRASHSLHHLAGNGPVGEITILRNLKGTQNRQINMAAADHREALGRVDEGRAGKGGNGLFAGVDEVRIDFRFQRERAHPEHAVFGLKRNLDAFGKEIGNKRGDADTQVYIVVVLEFTGSACGDVIAGPGHQTVSVGIVRCSIGFT